MGRRRRRSSWSSLGAIVVALGLAVTFLPRLAPLRGAIEGAIEAAFPIVLEGPSRATDEAIPYDREAWSHWSDFDHDCQDTRQEVLIAESAIPVEFARRSPTAESRDCKVARGRWNCPYTGKVFEDPRKMDVDHVVPLHEAHRSGGAKWSARRRQRYANALHDPEHLLAVSAAANRQKGDKGPETWLPEEPGFRCRYLRTWKRIKAEWELEMDAAERAAVHRGLSLCDRGEIPPRPSR